MPKILSAIALLLGLVAGPLAAQTYPSQSETTITDDAEMLDPVDEARLAARLTEIEQQRDADVALVTLISQALYTAGDDTDVYARNLMQSWEMGSTTNGRAVIMIVFRDDQELVIEVAGLDGDPATSVQAIIDATIVPAFADGDVLKGLTDGFNAIDAEVLTAEAQVETPTTTSEPDVASEEESGGGNALYWIGGVIAAAVAGIIGLNRRAAAKLAATPCPNCGATGLTRERVTLVEATEKQEGRGETRTSCPSCGHVTAEAFTISKRQPAQTDKTKAGTKSDGGSGSW